MDNKELIEKADLVISDLTSGGGLLNAEQNDRFIRTLIDQPTILRDARTVPMDSSSTELNKIGFGTRILKPAVENTGLGAGDRSAPTTSKVTLTTSEVIAEVRLPYAVIEDNIERGNMTNTVLDLIAERAALDLEELIIQGDTASGDAYLALMDGVVKSATSNTAAGLDISLKDLFNNMIKAMPTQYRRNLKSLKMYVPHDIEQDYRNAQADRGSDLGDAILSGSGDLPVFGIGMRGAALMPVQTAILTNPLNILVGIQRNIRIESEKLISERQYKFVLTARIATALEEETAVVKGTGLGTTT
jgi:hypothetical protein